MKVDAQSLLGPTFTSPIKGSGQPKKAADNHKETVPVETKDVAEKQTNENLIKQIKALTEDGLYSVNFELDQESQQLIVRLVDSENGKLIRQFPSEEVLALTKALKELQGNLINTLS